MLSTCLLAACALAAHGGPAQPITVSAAISLTEVMHEIGGAYEAAAGQPVIFNVAGSNVLARQIVNGAPVDVFISADEAQMALVEKAGMVSAGTLVPVLGNQLAIVVRTDRSDLPASAAVLTAPDVRVAIADPEAVPAGVYAKQYLERVGLWPTLRDRVLPVGSVRAVLAAVKNGAADTGIVYVTDAGVSPAVRIATAIAGPEAPRIVYFAGVIASSKRKDAAGAFVAFLRTTESSRIFERHGFRPLAAGR